MALFRQVPAHIFNFIRRQFIVSLDVQEKDSSFYWLTQWLDKHPYAAKSRAISVSAIHSADEPRAIYTPAPGLHFLWYRHRPVWLTRTREKPTAGNLQTETFTIRTIGRSPALLREMVAEALALSLRPDNKITVFASQREYWQKVSSFSPRPLSTVLLPDGIAERMKADIEEFRANKEWYEERGIPWRRGYLFKGPPGTGKSSLITALAGAINFDLYVLSLTTSGLSDDGLTQLLLNIPKGGALLLEDIDSVLDGRNVKAGDSQNAATVTFSGILNALDGVASKPGLMVFMTTNHPERLDPALIRPGRVDVQVEFPHATPELMGRFFQHFYGKLVTPGLVAEFVEAASNGEGLSMASVQQLLLAHKTDPTAAIKALAA